MTKTLIKSVAHLLRKPFHQAPPMYEVEANSPVNTTSPVNTKSYEALYEAHAVHFEGETSVGAGNYDEIGLIELELLQMEGLKPEHTLLDFGCGNGRLALHAIPYLNQNATYIGIDISETYLKQAHENINRHIPDHSCRVEWIHQNTPNFPLADQRVDLMCAFSVFTHMENEDTYHYLKSALRILKPGGKFIFSCLPLDLEYARSIFLEEAAMDLAARWERVRNVTTSKELMTQIAEIAGWKVLRWYEGEEKNIGRPNGTMRQLGQSACVLKAA